METTGSFLPVIPSNNAPQLASSTNHTLENLMATMKHLRSFLPPASRQGLVGQNVEKQIIDALESYAWQELPTFFAFLAVLNIFLSKTCIARALLGLLCHFYFKGHSIGASYDKEKDGLVGIYLGVREICQCRIGQWDRFSWGGLLGSPRKHWPLRWWDKRPKKESGTLSDGQLKQRENAFKAFEESTREREGEEIQDGISTKACSSRSSKDPATQKALVIKEPSTPQAKLQEMTWRVMYLEKQLEGENHRSYLYR